MSNSVAKFIVDNSSSAYNHHFIIAYNSDYKVHISLDSLSLDTQICVRKSTSDNGLFITVTKDQITHLLSLDCPDAFIAYALTLCPCPPETLDCAVKSDLSKVDGGILVRHALLSESVSNDLMTDCPICYSPTHLDELTNNGGACNFCFNELQNDSYLNSLDLERRLL